MSIYNDKGFENREAYLVDLANCHGVALDIVYAAADMYGENEDFDGLVTTVEDYAMGVYG